MTDNHENGAFTDRDDLAKTNALVAYILMVLGLFTGVFWFAGAFWAMVKNSSLFRAVFVEVSASLQKLTK